MRAANEFEAIGFGERDDTEVGGLAGSIDGDAIDDEFVVGGLAAANEERGDAATLAGIAEDGSGKNVQSVGGGDGLEGIELRVGEGVGLGA